MSSTVSSLFQLVANAVAANASLVDIPIIDEAQFDTPGAVEAILQDGGVLIAVGLPQFDRYEARRVRISMEVLAMVNPEKYSALTADNIAENLWVAFEGYQSIAYPQFTPIRPLRMEQTYADGGILVCAVDVELTSGIRITSQ